MDIYKQVKDLTGEILSPLIADFKKDYQETLELNEQRALIKKTKKQKAQAVKDMEEEVREWIIDKKGIELVEKGVGLLIKNVNRLPNPETLKEELKKVQKTMLDREKEEELHIYETLAEAYGFSGQLLSCFYDLGILFLQENKLENALALFTVITKFNPYIFAPWYSSGLGWKQLKNDHEALHCLAWATIIEPNHPGPHLHSAEIYLHLNNKELAKETYDLGVKKQREAPVVDLAKFTVGLGKEFN